MKHINFFLDAFGFKNLGEYTQSTFGYMANPSVVSISLIIGSISAFLKEYLGFPLIVFSAFVVLNILEFQTGIKASKKKGKKR